MSSNLINNFKPNTLTVAGKWVLSRKLGEGSFGEIFEGYNINDPNEKVAVKLESSKALVPQLLYESRLYNVFNPQVGICKLLWFGKEGDFNIMVLQLCGKTLEEQFEICGRKFTLKTVLLIIDQLLRRIESIHMKNYIHRDIKPENFLCGLNDNLIYLIDFGLTKKFKNTTTNKHIPYKEEKKLAGTVRYISINTHLGVQQSRRDDLESLGYLFIYFTTGTLPWQGVKANSKLAKFQKICEIKQSTSIEDLCKGLPIQFKMYIDYVRNLGFSDDPDYKFMRKLFRDLYIEQKFECEVDSILYDWNIKASQPIESPKQNNPPIKKSNFVRKKDK